MDNYDIFGELADENDASDREESFVDETPIENIQTIKNTDPESETPFPVTESDPLGLVGKVYTTTQNTTHTNNTNQSHVAMKFDLPEHSSIIKVIGVGGGGSNAVNHMYRQGINGVDFIVCNTDKQALDMSPVPHKIVLGTTLTEGRGAGSLPEVGRNAAIENIEDIRSLLSNNTKMVFITAGMGGGTGTGAAPIIAGIAREMGILTVAIVTVPFLFEGKKRRLQAEEGLEQLKQNVDTLLVVCNDKLREMYGNLKLSDAFSHADDVLAIAAKSIAEVISLTQQINVDFADVCTVMRNSGVAIMGSAAVSGENRSTRAVEMALNSPLLNDNNITGARYVLLNIISGENEITMDELGEITDYIQEAAGQTAEIIKGYGVDPSLGDSVNVTIIATGFNQNNPIAYEYSKKQTPEKVVLNLDEKKSVEVIEEKTVEAKTETVNPLEPYLVSKQPEPSSEVKTEVEIIANELSNPLEPFLVEKAEVTVVTSEVEEWSNPVSEIEVTEEIVETPVAEIEVTEEFIETPVAEINIVEEVSEIQNWQEEVNMPVAETDSEESIEEFSHFEAIYSPVAEITLSEEIAEQINGFESSEIVSETVSSSEDIMEPVTNENVEFEITNFNDSNEVVTESEITATTEESASENLIEKWINVAETEKEVVAETTIETVAELTETPVAEISETPVAENTIEIISETTTKIVSETVNPNEPFLIKKEETVAEAIDIISAKQNEEELAKKVQAEELQKKAQERIQKLKELSLKLKTPQGLNEMEHEPAYKRRNINLDNVPHSSESQVSRYTLSENDDKKVEIKPNNSFLHDNVD
ncbi:cell division protein FtsZ [soil metagenome]